VTTIVVRAEVDLGDVDTSDLVRELDARAKKPVDSPSELDLRASADLVFNHFYVHGGAPDVLRDYLYGVLGRTLP
jgi:hypothetical protein